MPRPAAHPLPGFTVVPASGSPPSPPVPPPSAPAVEPPASGVEPLEPPSVPTPPSGPTPPSLPVPPSTRAGEAGDIEGPAEQAPMPTTTPTTTSTRSARVRIGTTQHRTCAERCWPLLTRGRATARARTRGGSGRAPGDSNRAGRGEHRSPPRRTARRRVDCLLRRGGPPREAPLLSRERRRRGPGRARRHVGGRGGRPPARGRSALRTRPCWSES